MTTAEAYNLLVHATATIQADRVTHQKIEQALVTIKSLIPRQEKPAAPTQDATDGVDKGQKNP